MAWKTKIPSRLLDAERRVHDNSDYCIGVRMISDGGGSGTWEHVNEENTPVILDSTYFSNHPIWGGISDVVIDSQYMVKIPKFYIKTDEDKAIWISNTKRAGFRVHPAFMKAGSEVNNIYIGKYQASLSGTKLCSVPGVAPLVSKSMNDFNTYAANRNVSGVSGFCLWNIYMHAAIGMLFLVEHASTDCQGICGRGRVDTSSSANVDASDVAQATYRGMVGLWGNVWQWVNGIGTNQNGPIWVWDNDGNETQVLTNSTLAIFYNNTNNEWNSGINCGWYRKRLSESNNQYNLADLFVPDAESISSTYTDGTYSDFVFGRYPDSNQRVCSVGGRWVLWFFCGLFCFRFFDTASDSGTSIGGRLAKF